MADGPYCDVFFRNGRQKTEVKTLKKMLEMNPDMYLRVNRKVAVLKEFVELEHPDKVILKNGEVCEFSRRRKPSYIMKKIGVLMFFLAIVTSAYCQTGEPESKVLTVKKVVKLGEKFYIETTSTTKTYVEMTTEQVLGVDRDTEDDKIDQAEIDRAERLKKERQAERLERNRFLREAMRQGYVPQARTVEEAKKIEAIRKRLKL